MSIKVKVGGGRNIKAVPKQDSTTSIVAPGERKPQIVPDSVVLGIDTLGPYIQRIDAGPGVIVFPEDDIELANVVISHANTSTEVSTNNDVLSFTRNVRIDNFGHVIGLDSNSLSSLNFTANGSLIQAKDFTLGLTSLTIGESTSTIEGLSTLGVDGQFTAGSVNVNDLSQGRIVYVGANGELIDSANLRFDDTSIIATGGVFLDDLSVPGQSTFGSVNILDLQEGRIMYAGANGELIDSANLSFDGVSITATGGVFLDILSVPGQSTLGSVNITDLTQDRIVHVGPQGELIDSGKLTFDGSTFVVDGDADITGNITIGGNIILGDAPIDTINVVADFTSDIIPDESGRYNLGSVNKNWFRVYTEALKSDTGVIKIDENGALVLPTGSTGERPTAETGMIRYNTSDARFEGYDGTQWSELAGSVKDVNKDTFIRAETAPGDNNDDLDFFTAGVQRLQINQDGDFNYANGAVIFDYDTGIATFSGAEVADLVTSGIVTVGPNGRLRNSANLAWDGFTLTIVGGISVDGDFSTSGGLSGDSLSVGNLQANTMMFVSDTGALSSNNNIRFDGSHMTVNATSAFFTAPTIETVAENQVFVAGANGALEGSSGLTYDGSKLDVTGNVDVDGDVDITGSLTIGDGGVFGGTQVTVPSINVLDLTPQRVVFTAANGELVDSADLTWNGSKLYVDGDAEFTGDVTIAGNLQLGDNVVDTINVVADFTSDLIPKDDNAYDIGAAGSNWQTVYTRKIDTDTEVLVIDTTGAIVVPVGTAGERPVNLQTGMVRFNSTDGVFEGYSGTAWASLGGVKDVDQDTYIQAESSPGADNDELEFFTAGQRRLSINGNGDIITDASTTFSFGGDVELYWQDANSIFDVGNNIITGVNDPVNSFDAVNLNYLENSYARDITVANGGNTHILELLANNPKIILDSTITVTEYDSVNNEITIGLDPVWSSFTGLREAGVEGTVPNFDFDVYGRVRSLINIPLSVSSNAVVDFVPSIYGVLEDAIRNGNVEEGIVVTANSAAQKIDFRVDNFDVTLDGAVEGTATVNRLSNTTIQTTLNFTDSGLDDRFVNETGDTMSGTLAAPRFADSANTNYYVEPDSTSRIRDLVIGYGQGESSIQMSTGPTSFQYIYATSTRIGYLSNNFNFGTYFDTINNSWRVTDGSVYSRNFIDSQNENYLLNPAGNNSRFLGLNLDESITIGSNLTIANNTITTTSGGITFNPSTNNIDVGSSIITNILDPVNSLDAVNKQYLEGEVTNINASISAITANGISIGANTGSTDTVALGDTIIFAGGPGIDTAVSNNQILISGNAGGILDLVKTVDGSGSGLDADLLDGANGTFYLDYTNFTNTPSDLDVLNQIKNVDGANSGLDADLLDGLDSTQFLRSDEDDTFDGNLVITGDLTVSGNTTYVNTETILLSDNIITLNANFTGPFASQNAGIEVERGGESNVILQWNESQNYWEIASGGITGRILTTGDEGSGNGLDADTLDGQQGTYYLDFANFTSLPDPQIDVNITGKVTGTGTTTLTNLGNGTINIAAELANTTVVPGTYGTASQIPIITVDEDGRLTAASNVAVAGVESLNWYTANNTLEISTVDGNVFQQDIDTFGATIDVTDIVVTGTVDGRDVSVDGAKLDTIQAGAQVNPSNTEIFQAILTLDGAGSGLDADLLDGANGTFYLDYTNFTNTPSDLDILNQIKNVDGAGSGLDADLLDGANSDFYLDYTNFTNTPSDVDILNQIKNVDGAGSGLDADLLDGANSDFYLDFTNFTNIPDPQIDVTLTGKVTGTGTTTLTDLANGLISITTELANTAVSPGTYGGATSIPIITVDEDGRLTNVGTAAVAGISDTEWYSANNTYQITTGDGSSFNTVISQFDANVDFGAGIDVTGDITVTGNVDGRDVSVDGAKLDTIQSGAQVNLSNTEILEAIKTVDGDGSGLDADTLDGLHASEISAGAANTAIANIGAGTITITANTGLTGVGTFTVNDFSNTSIIIEHADTSTVANVDNSGPNVVQDITFDTFGHVQTVGSIDLDSRYYTETEIDTLLTGKVDNTVNVLAGSGLSGGGPLSANVTISHADTSSVANTGTLDLANAEVIESVSFDEFGHVVAITTGNLAVLTQDFADETYVNVDGDTMTGDLTVPNLNANTVVLDHATLTSASATTATTSSTQIWTFSATTYNSAEIVITATQGINRHITKLLVVHNGTTSSATEFGTIYTNTSLGNYDVGLSGGNVTLSVTPANGTNIEYKISATLMID